MNPYENTKKLDELFNKLNTIAHDRAGLFDTPIVNEVYKIIEKEKIEAVREFAEWLYAGGEKAVIERVVKDFLKEKDE